MVVFTIRGGLLFACVLGLRFDLVGCVCVIVLLFCCKMLLIVLLRL